jgi:hypothetical protein
MYGNHLHFLAYLSMILNHLQVVYVTSDKWMYEYHNGVIRAFPWMVHWWVLGHISVG